MAPYNSGRTSIFATSTRPAAATEASTITTSHYREGSDVKNSHPEDFGE
jgi:hypothetical protein